MRARNAPCISLYIVLALLVLTAIPGQRARGQAILPIMPPSVVLRGPEDQANKHLPGWLFPVLDAKSAAAFWNQEVGVSLLNFGNITGNLKAGSATTEIVSDFFGPVRVGLSGVVSATDTSKHDASAVAQRFVAGGGTAVLTTAWPIVSATHSGNYLVLLVDPRLGFDFPALGSSTSTTTANVDIGGDVRYQYLGTGAKLGFIGQFHAARVVGGSSFYDALDSETKSSFNYTAASFGLLVPALKLGVMWNRTLSGPRVLQHTNNGQLTLMVTGR